MIRSFFIVMYKKETLIARAVEWRNVIFFSLLSECPTRFGLIFALVKLREPLEASRDLPV